MSVIFFYFGSRPTPSSSVPIAYATPYLRQRRLRPGRGADIGWQMMLLVDLGAVPDANFLFARAQNCHFYALLPFGTPIFGSFKHKNGIFVRFCPSEPSFSGISSTKLPFLCAFALRNPYFRVFQAQKGLFVSERATFPRFYPIPSTKLRFLCSGCCNRGDA